MKTNERILFIPDEQATLQLGTQLALSCGTARTIIFLKGALGAGKTTLVRGFLRGLGHQGSVKSPTYTLVEPYELPQVNIFHFDLYRLNDPEELEFIGIQDYFAQEALFLVEWPEQGQGWLPMPDVSCYIELKANGREITMQADTPRGKDVLEKM